MLEIMNGTMLNILKVERRNEEKKMPKIGVMHIRIQHKQVI